MPCSPRLLKHASMRGQSCTTEVSWTIQLVVTPGMKINDA